MLLQSPVQNLVTLRCSADFGVGSGADFAASDVDSAQWAPVQTSQLLIVDSAQWDPTDFVGDVSALLHLIRCSSVGCRLQQFVGAPLNTKFSYCKQVQSV